MTTVPVGVAVYGATGRMARQHPLPALLDMREAGGLELPDGRRLVPEPILLGRDAGRVASLARNLGIERHGTDLDAALREPDVDGYFDAATPADCADRLRKALAAGCHVYSEKPLTPDLAAGRHLIELAEAAGLKHGAVEDKLHLPGISRMRHLVRSGLLGRIHRFHLEFGSWVFDGKGGVPCQRSSWNYRARTMGGIALDMSPHWRYVVEDLLGRIDVLSAMTWTATPERVDEAGKTYPVDVEDSCACLVSVAGGIHDTITSSWATRVRRDDSFSLQADGTDGSAVASYHSCHAACRAHPDRGIESRGRPWERSRRTLAGRAEIRPRARKLPDRMGRIPDPSVRRRPAGPVQLSRGGARRGLRTRDPGQRGAPVVGRVPGRPRDRRLMLSSR